MTPLVLQYSSPETSLTGSMDKRLGIAAIKLACWAPDLASAMLAPVPDFGVSGLVEWQPRTFTRSKSGEQGGYDVSVTVEGHNDPDGADEEYCEFEGSMSEDPIETHWNFDVLLAAYRGKLNSEKKVVWPRDLPPGEGNASPGNTTAATNPLFGTESFRNPGLIWTRNWVAKTVPASIIAELGTIVTPRGNPPGANGSRNWLCIRARGRQRGNIWQLASSYELSGPFGWVPEMYPRI